MIPSSVLLLLLLGSWHRLVIVAGYHHLFTWFRYLTLWPIFRSCVGNCSFLLYTLSCSGPSPCCFLATLDIGSCVWAVCDCRISIGDCNWLDSGVFCRSSSFYIGLLLLPGLYRIGFSLFVHAFLLSHFIADNGENLLCGLCCNLSSAWWRFQLSNKVHYWIYGLQPTILWKY